MRAVRPIRYFGRDLVALPRRGRPGAGARRALPAPGRPPRARGHGRGRRAALPVPRLADRERRGLPADPLRAHRPRAGPDRRLARARGQRPRHGPSPCAGRAAGVAPAGVPGARRPRLDAAAVRAALAHPRPHPGRGRERHRHRAHAPRAWRPDGGHHQRGAGDGRPGPRPPHGAPVPAVPAGALARRARGRAPGDHLLRARVSP